LASEPNTEPTSVPITRLEIIRLIEELAGSPQAFDRLEHSRQRMPKDELSRELLMCGIIPEKFAHDSSEEKLWAKGCDIILAQTLNHLNIEAKVIRARGNSADVFAQATDYTLVADAKAFRLSRTAKNQKDFKIGALDDWRRMDTFACLVAPLYQFPTNSSQIYRQAEQKNVTLLAYVHLKFLLDFVPTSSLINLWQIPGTLTPSPDASAYWTAIERAIIEITEKSETLLAYYKQQEIEYTRQIGKESIAYWESILENYQAFSREDAIAALIHHTGINAKIQTIRRTIAESRPK